MLLKIQWGKEEITKGGIFKIRKINFMNKNKRKGEGNLLVIKDYFSTIKKSGAGLLLQVTIIFIEVTMHCSAMQLFIILLCIFDAWNVTFFYSLSCKDCSKGLWCEWLQEGWGAQVFVRVQVCREGSASRVLPCSARPAPGAPWLCFTLYWTDRLIRNPSIFVALPCSPWSRGHTCVIFLALVDLWGFLTVFLYWQCWCECSECLCCWTSDRGRPFSSHLLLRFKRKAAVIK